MLSAMARAPHAVVDATGRPAFGRYAGVVANIDWSTLSGEHRRSGWWRRLHHKRWQYVGLGSDEVFVGLAVVHLGWGMSAFAYVFDRAKRRVLVDWSQEALPGLGGTVSSQPVQGLNTRFKGRRARVSMVQCDGHGLQVSVDVPGLQMQVALNLSTESPFLLAVGAISGGVAHATQKSPALTAKGWVHTDGLRVSLDRAVGSLDSSNGLLARDTRWQWASAHRADVGFNLQQGYFGSCENVLWLRGEMIPLGEARFTFDSREPLAPWHVRTDDGLLDLRFQPEGARQHRRNLGLVSSDYIQPVGTFEGQVRRSIDAAPVEVQGLLGVTEDHRSLW